MKDSHAAIAHSACLSENEENDEHTRQQMHSSSIVDGQENE